MDEASSYSCKDLYTAATREDGESKFGPVHFLPADILIRICTHIQTEEWKTLRQVCCGWKKVVELATTKLKPDSAAEPQLTLDLFDRYKNLCHFDLATCDFKEHEQWKEGEESCIKWSENLLLKLNSLPHLHELRFCVQGIAEVLSSIQGVIEPLTQVTSLVIDSFDSRYRPPGLLHLFTWLPRVQKLSLSFETDQHSSGWEELVMGFPHLKDIHMLAMTPLVFNDEGEEFSTSPQRQVILPQRKFERISLSGDGFDRLTYRELASFSSLTALELGTYRHIDKEIQLLKNLTSLTRLYLDFNDEPPGLGALAALTGLEELQCSNTVQAPRPLHLELIKRLPALTELKLMGTNWFRNSPAEMNVFLNKTSLRSLQADGMPNLTFLQNLIGLQSLSMCVDETSTGMTEGLSGLKDLTSLRIGNCGRNSIPFPHCINGLTRLQILGLSHTQATDDDMRHMAMQLSSLTRLSLADSEVTYKGLAELKDLPLEFLNYSFGMDLTERHSFAIDPFWTFAEFLEASKGEMGMSLLPRNLLAALWRNSQYDPFVFENPA